MFTSSMKLAEVIQANFNLLSVTHRFGIKLGFGDKTVGQVCSHYDINTSFFIEIVNTYNDNSYFPQKHLQRFLVTEIIDYLRKTHQHYVSQSIPFAEKLMNELTSDSQNPSEIKLIQKFFFEYKDELLKHLAWEENTVFPYALGIETAFLHGKSIESALAQMKSFSMSTFLDEHDDIESKLNDIKTLFVKYIPPLANQDLCYKILRELWLLELDIANHARIEEKVLAPKVAEMEKSLLAL